MEKIKQKNISGYIIFALVMLFNPNINLFDFLPDFIGYFIFARVFLRAADAAPYFEEARRGFLKLAYINLAKIAGIAIIGIVRSGNIYDYDIYALMALTFAIVELIYLIPTVKNIFDALTYLGERTDAKSLIKSDSLISTDALRSLTYVFVIFKCVLYSLPEMLRMTGNFENITNSFASKFYPISLSASLILGIIFGGVWLFRMIKYVTSIKREGRFLPALEAIAEENSYDEFIKKINDRSINRTFIYFILAAVLSFDLIFDNFNEVNLLPNVIFGVLFSIGLIRLCRHANVEQHVKNTVIALSSIYIVISSAAYYLSIQFLDKFGYEALLNSTSEAHRQYLIYEVLSAAELLVHIALAVSFFIVMKKFTNENLGFGSSGINIDHDDQYHKYINKKTAILTSLSTLSGIAHMVNIISNGNVKNINMQSVDNTTSMMTVASIPGFNLVIAAIVIIYSFYSVYYFNMIKDERK